MAESLWEIQARLIYAPIVAGKSAKFANDVVVKLLQYPGEMPFEIIRNLIRRGKLLHALKTCKTGSYGRLSKCLPKLIELDAETCTIEELEAVHGIGPKTARFFLLWTRPSVRYAALDTHILKYLRSLGYDAPKSTPQNPKRYKELEEIFLKEADKQGKTARELDYEVWEKHSSARNVTPER